MPIAYGGYKNSKRYDPKIARVYHGKCQICKLPVIKGEAYLPCVGGTTEERGYLAHYNCYKPDGAPTWEELRANKAIL